jgi:hypothetical protein
MHNNKNNKIRVQIIKANIHNLMIILIHNFMKNNKKIMMITNQKCLMPVMLLQDLIEAISLKLGVNITIF